MDFLKSAVASAISKDPPFPYKFGDRVNLSYSIWSLFNGTRKDNGTDCSIFTFTINNDRSRLPLARNAVKKLRTIRHPGVIQVFDTVETETYIYIATERVTPLESIVARKTLGVEVSKWGLHTIANTIAFINNEAVSVHGNVNLGSIFVSRSGEWRVGGFEALSSMKEEDPTIFRYGSMLSHSNHCGPPETYRSGWEAIKSGPISAADSWGLGLLVCEVYTGSYIDKNQIGMITGIPVPLQKPYKSLLNQSPKSRLSASAFRDQGRAIRSYFDTPLIKLGEGINDFGLKNESERTVFLTELDNIGDDCPSELFSARLLPELLKVMEFGGGGPKVWNSILNLGKRLSDDEWESKLTPFVVRLFANPDRAIRVCLLDSLPSFIDHLTQKIVSDKIFPQMATGFTDLVPLVREQTVKAVLVIITKLTDRLINGELLKYLAKTSNDEQPGIRTNTTICMGKIARNLGVSTRQRVLIAAFTRSLRDPFVHARNAALLALTATADLFNEEDCASRILPGICPSLVDKEKMVRDQANKCFDTYLARVRKFATTLPDSILPRPTASSANSSSNVRQADTTTSSDAAGWTGWAISSFTNKMGNASGSIQAQASATLQTLQPPPVSASAEPTISDLRALNASASTATISSPPQSQLKNDSSSLLQPTSLLDEDINEVDEAWDVFDNDNIMDAPARMPPTLQPTPVAFEDTGEPDFEGWLQAQAQTKSKPKNALPKGLAKTSKPNSGQYAGAKASLPVRSSQLNGSALSKPLAPAKSGSTGSKTIDVKPQDNDDDWGDAWG